MPLFHVTPLPLAPGSLILASNWGRILRQYRNLHQNHQGALTLAREMIFERVRASEFPGRPSRMECAYVFEGLEGARKLRAAQPGIAALIYEIALDDPNALQFRTDYDLVIWPPADAPFLSWTENQARTYWADANPVTPEILTMSRIKIVQLIE